MGTSRWILCFALIATLRISAFAEGSHERTQFGHDIVVGADENATDVTCFSCGVRIRGRVTGDVTTFGGTVVVEPDGEITGDTTVFGGDLRLEARTKVKEVAVFGGKLHRDHDASVQGDVTTFGGGASLWLFIVFGLPFVVLGALIALIVWLVRRFSRPALPVPALV